MWTLVEGSGMQWTVFWGPSWSELAAAPKWSAGLHGAFAALVTAVELSKPQEAIIRKSRVWCSLFLSWPLKAANLVEKRHH